MIIHKPHLSIKGNSVYLSADFESNQGDGTLWYSFDKKYEEYLTVEKMDGFVIALLLLAMKNGENIKLQYPISEKLYYNLSNYYIKLLYLINNKVSEIKIHADSLSNEKTSTLQNAVGAGFSGGIDSFCLLYDHLENKLTPAGYKLTHLVFNNVGAHGEYDSVKANKLFNERYELQKPFVDELGKEFIKIDSNLSDILKMDFAKTHTPRNLSSILLLQKLFSRYLYASGYSYRDCHVEKSGEIDPITLSLLSTETLEFVSVGSQYTRPQKTKIVAAYEPSYRFLNVCLKQLNNCSECSKCARTMVTLDILGELEKYQNIFDLNKYKKNKTKYIEEIIKSARKNRLSKEVFNLIKEYDHELPFKLKLMQTVTDLVFKIKK